MVRQILPLFIDLATDRPLPGRESHFQIVNHYRDRIAFQNRQWSEAERLQRSAVDNARKAAKALPADSPDARRKAAFANLSVSLQKLGNTLLGEEDPECVTCLEEAFELLERNGETAGGGAECACNLGTAYRSIGSVRNLDRSEQWYVKSLRLRHPQDKPGQGETYAMLGNLHVVRLEEAVQAGDARANKYWQAAVECGQRALDLLPAEYRRSRGAVHQSLGFLLLRVNREDSMHQYREAIRDFEDDGDHYSAGGCRAIVALALETGGKPREAIEFAEAALRSYRACNDRLAIEGAQRVESLIADIRRQLEG
jgi:tetratricopeptide (TPR) repeat protein